SPPPRRQRRRQVDRSEEEEEVGVPEEAREVHPPGVQPVEDREEHALARREDARQGAVEDEKGQDMEGEHDEAGRPVVAPEEERQPHQEAGEPARVRPSRGHRVAVGDEAALRGEEPAAGEEVELIAADLLAKEQQDRQQQTDREERPDEAGGGRFRGASGGREHEWAAQGY